MVEELRELLKNSYSPYSKFPVSCVLITKDGKKYKGVNVEDASTRAGTCAERAAIFSAISDGVKKNEFKEINIMVNSNEISTPCEEWRLVATFFAFNISNVSASTILISQERDW